MLGQGQQSRDLGHNWQVTTIESWWPLSQRKESSSGDFKAQIMRDFFTFSYNKCLLCFSWSSSYCMQIPTFFGKLQAWVHAEMSVRIFILRRLAGLNGDRRTPLRAWSAAWFGIGWLWHMLCGLCAWFYLRCLLKWSRLIWPLHGLHPSHRLGNRLWDGLGTWLPLGG